MYCTNNNDLASVIGQQYLSGRKPEVFLVPDMKLFAGNATPELAQRVANRLYTNLGDAAVGRFSDGGRYR